MTRLLRLNVYTDVSQQTDKYLFRYYLEYCFKRWKVSYFDFYIFTKCRYSGSKLCIY